MKQLNKIEKIDALNIALMLFSCAAAIILPFELFLLSYAILGPLHYLTEISWLQKKNFYTTGRRDTLLLIAIGVAITIIYYNLGLHLNLNLNSDHMTELIFAGLACALVMVLIKNTLIKIIGCCFIFLLSPLAVPFPLFFIVLLPTLFHVYLFTGMFMLYGALKSKSRIGLLAVTIFAMCPAILWNAFPNTTFIPLSAYGKAAYFDNGSPNGFFTLNMVALNRFLGINPVGGSNEKQLRDFWINAVFYSKTGVLVARIVAFAYIYHYLNWFSKTSIIQWHKMSKWKLSFILVIWILSIALYAYDYMLGTNWLFLLSFLHIILEFPLNFVSLFGITLELRTRLHPLLKTRA